MHVLRRGVDSYAHADPHVLTALGVTWAGQYLLGSKDKDITAAVAQALHAAGHDILLNAENTATDADGGYQQGVNFAILANQQADAAGAPSKNFDGSLVDIYYSVDSQRSADQVRPYYQGANSVGRTRSVSGYGGTEIRQMKREKLSRRWWQANAGSWSGWNTSNFDTDPEADIRQHLATAFQGYSYDPNDQMSRDCGLWLSPFSTLPGGNELTDAEMAQILGHIDASITAAVTLLDQNADARWKDLKGFIYTEQKNPLP